MVSTDKLIKVGVKYSDKYFDDLIQYYIRTYNNNERLEEFLADLGEYGVSNPLDAGEFNDTLTNIICSSLNDIRFSRPAQKALMNNVIKQTTGELITNVGDTIRDSVRDIVRRGYNSKTLSHTRVADEISSTLTGINRKRARVIARTEIKRAQTTSNYLVSRERGANAYRYKCGGEPCSICKKDCGKTYPIDDLEHLPPRHPNCMCGVTFFKDPDLPEVKPSIPQITTEPTGVVPTTKKTNTKQSTKNKEIKKSTSKSKSNNTLLKGEPKVYSEMYEHMDTNYKISQHKLTTYDYGNVKISFENGVSLTHDEIASHIRSLPSTFKNSNATRITFYKDPKKDVGGLWKSTTKEVAVYNCGSSTKLSRLDTLNHELAHSIDVSGKNATTVKLKYSDPKIYEKIFKADNKLYEYKGPTGRTRKPKKFPTEYAGRSYAKYKRKGISGHLFVEDFAESSKLYLNPSTHKQFVKDFPNRAKYLESIYGKPKTSKTLSNALSEEKKLAESKAKAKDIKKLKDEKFNALTEKELDNELEKLLGDKERVKSYHAMEKEVKKLESVAMGVTTDDVQVLINAGWNESMAKKIMANPNAYLSKINQKKHEIKNVINEVNQLVKDNLDLNKKTTVKPKTTEKAKSKSTTNTKPKSTTKPKTETKSKSKSQEKPKSKSNTDPVARGKKVTNTTYDTYGDNYKGLKSVEYEDGTKITFRRAKSADPDYHFQTLDEVTINGKTYKYEDTSKVHSRFKYQDAQLTKEELKFADEFIEKYGTYAGQEFNTFKRGRLSKKDLESIKDDHAFKWLNDNFDKYNKILDKSVIEDDVVTMRIQTKNYTPKGATTIQDKGYTSTSASKARDDLIDCFGNARDLNDNWTYITVTPKGTTGARFQGNSVARIYGSLDDDFEQEITYKPNMKFDILLQDDENKIMILQPQ